MSDEFDVFAQTAKSARQFQQTPQAAGQGGGGEAQPSAAQAQDGGVKRQAQGGGVRHFRGKQQPRQGGAQQQRRTQKQGNSPLRGPGAGESVNPLLNAPLPKDTPQTSAEAPQGNRNPDLAEYRLADIQTWPAQQIVDRMMPGADPE